MDLSLRARQAFVSKRQLGTEVRSFGYAWQICAADYEFNIVEILYGKLLSNAVHRVSGSDRKEEISWRGKFYSIFF
jgi:hypothetical protein